MTSYSIGSGVTTGYFLFDGDVLTVDRGGISIDSVLAREAEARVFGGGVLSGGAIALGGVADGDGAFEGILVGGDLEVQGPLFTGDRGGVAIGNTIVNGGSEVVGAGGASRRDVVRSGGTLALASGAVASNDRIASGGSLEFSGDISGQTVTAALSVSATTIFAGVTLSRGASLVIDQATVLSGATLSLAAGAFADSLSVSSGGAVVGPGEAAVIFDGGSVSGVKVESGDALEVASGASAHGDLIGGLEGILGVAADETIVSGGFVTVDGQASGTVVSLGGVLRIEAGGIAEGTLLHGGIETVRSGGTATGTTVSSGYEFDFGVTLNTVIRSGGHEVVGNRGTASGSVISSGGRELVSSGGFAAAATVESGGTLIVSSGGSVSGGLTLNAGSATIIGIMAAGQTVSFAGAAGTLTLNNLSAFGAAISGFGGAAEKIDLGGFVFASSETATWAQTGTSGTLSVQDGAKTASLTLIGTYTTSDFQLTRDGHGGTLIGDPTAPAAVPATTRFAQAVAGFQGGRSAAGVATVHAGGSALIGASPLVGVATSGR